MAGDPLNVTRRGVETCPFDWSFGCTYSSLILWLCKEKISDCLDVVCFVCGFFKVFMASHYSKLAD